ncbi:MAG: GYF domain-containing protein [Pirellulales bacterium]|nr:GYF domain-containing protein [Pirellulales bacterium]
MSISVACPECGKRLKAPERLAGHKVKCPKCRHSWRLPLPKGKSKPSMPIADESRAASVTAIRKGRSAKAKAKSSEASTTKTKKRSAVNAKTRKGKSTKVAQAKQKTPVKKSVPRPKEASTKVRDKSLIEPRRSTGGEVDKPKSPTPPQPHSVGKSESVKSRETPPPFEAKSPPERQSPPPLEPRPPEAPPKLPELDAAPDVSAETPGADAPSTQTATMETAPVAAAPIESATSADSAAEEKHTEVADATETIAPPSAEPKQTEVSSDEKIETKEERAVGVSPTEEPAAVDTKPTSETESNTTDGAESEEKTKASDSVDTSSSATSRADRRWSNAESSVPAASLASESQNGSGSSEDGSPATSKSAEAETERPSVESIDGAPSDETGRAAPEDEPGRQDGEGLDPNVPWFVQTYLGEQFGPLIKVELDDRVTQGRLTGDCHVFHEGWDEWREARTVYPELELVKAEDEEIELAFAETEKAERTVSSSEPAWYTVRTGLTMINNSTIVAIVAFLLMTIGFFADRELLSEMYFGVANNEPIDPEEGGGLVSMVLVSWGVITMFMALVGILVGTIACMAVPRRTKVHPFAVGAVGAMSLTLLMATLLFTAVFLSLGPVAEKLDVGSAIRTLVTIVPWAFFLCAQGAMASIVVFVGMLADYLGQPKITRQMRWFGILQGAFLLWVLIDAAIIPNDSDTAFTMALFVFLVALIASLAWLTYLARAARDAIRPS